jgi:hypothetical protein
MIFQFRSCYFKLVQVVRFGHDSSGYERLAQVRSGWDMLGQVRSD